MPSACGSADMKAIAEYLDADAVVDGLDLLQESGLMGSELDRKVSELLSGPDANWVADCSDYLLAPGDKETWTARNLELRDLMCIALVERRRGLVTDDTARAIVQHLCENLEMYAMEMKP